MASAPIISFRQAIAPYTPITSLNFYTETIANQTGLPTLSGDSSITTTFRIYNNFNAPPSSSIATAYDIIITTYDGASIVSHTATTYPIIQMWIYLAQNGFGENSSYNVLYTYSTDDSVAVGGSNNTKSFTYGSDGSAASKIRAGSSLSGTGMIEVNTLAKVALGQSTNVWNFGLNATYHWNS
jgi:hypothetical protein